MAKSIQVQTGGPQDFGKFLDNTKLETDLAKPSPGHGEVVVRVTLRPVNPADIFTLQGVYAGFQPSKFPATPGLEGMGRVEEVGEGVTGFSKGQRVVPVVMNEYSVNGMGSWQDYVVVRAEDVVPVPDSVSDGAAAQLVVNPFTVVGMLNIVNVPAGEYLLQTAAGSVLGRQVISVAKHRGIKTINIVRRRAQVEELKALGADEVICSADEDIAARVKDISGGKGAYAALDAVAGDQLAVVGSAVRDFGTVIIYGAMSGFTFQGGVGDLLFRNVTIRGYWLTHDLKVLGQEGRSKLYRETMELMEKKTIDPYLGEVFDLADFKAAVEKTKSEGRGGKILLSS